MPQESIAEAKLIFMNGGAVPDGVPDDIADSWQRSRKYGIRPSGSSLPDKLNKDVLTNLIVQLNIRDSYFYEAEARLLDSVGAAIVFTNDHLDVFAIRGSKALKDELRAINFRFGANLAESRIGTNALAIAYFTGKETWVCGEEHYLSALTRYVCVATCAKVSDGLRSGIVFPCMIIMPADRFREDYRDLFSYMLKTHLYRQNSLMNSNYLIYNAVINELIGKNSIYYLAVNNDEKIIDISDNLLQAFNLNLNRTVGNRLDALFPCLASAINDGKNDAVTQVSGCLPVTSPTRGKYYVRCHYVLSDGELIGRVLLLSKNAAELSGLPDHNAVYKDTVSDERRLTPGNGSTYVAKWHFDDLSGSSGAFSQALYKAQRVAKSQSSVLITGESGTGKELFAQAIHNAGDRRYKPFVSLNCAAMPRELIDSELFGYVEGAFTGARKNGAAGKIELANGGTLFLDEIGDMPLDLQVHLLKVLEDRYVTRLGDSKRRHVDIRIIAATNRKLDELVADGSFRLDLYYRLNVFSLELPPLRNRSEDIPALTQAFLAQCSGALKKSVTAASPEVLRAFAAYRWPGNLRELKNAVEYAVNLAASDRIELADLPSRIAQTAASAPADSSAPSVLTDIGKRARQRENDLIAELMEQYHGNKSRVAAELGISRPALYRRLKQAQGETQPGE